MRGIQVGMAQSPGGGKREMKVLIACEESQTVCKTVPGIAKAMAEQWGGDVREET